MEGKLKFIITGHPGAPCEDILRVVGEIREKYPDAEIWVKLQDCYE